MLWVRWDSIHLSLKLLRFLGEGRVRLIQFLGWLLQGGSLCVRERFEEVANPTLDLVDCVLHRSGLLDAVVGAGFAQSLRLLKSSLGVLSHVLKLRCLGVSGFGSDGEFEIGKVGIVRGRGCLACIAAGVGTVVAASILPGQSCREAEIRS